MKISERRKAVAPVIATLLMIAVAVAMSVIIFMWSQGFLSQTSSSTGGQQGAQNQAAQSSVAIETGTFVDGTSKTDCTGPCTVTIIVRNVGAVAVTLGSIQISGISSNAGFSGSLLISTLTGVTAVTSGTAQSLVTSSDPSTWKVYGSASLANSIAKGGAVSITLFWASTSPTTTSILSGDVINIKITTNVGTFAQAQFTAP